MSWFSSAILLPLLEWFISKEEPVVLAWVKSQIDEWNRAQTDSKNVTILQSTVATGGMSAIDKAGLDLLNGTDPK